MKPILKLENVNYSYNNKVNVLTDINLSINSGEDVAIIGHNGSGKSTLGKLLISLLKPKQGQLLFNGVVIDNKNDNLIREKSGMVFQNPDNQFIGVTVKDDIAFGLENKCVPHQDMDKIINEYAAKMGVSHLLEKEPANLSGGQKQRVALAGILAMLPDIIVFDEALAMLDPRGKNDITNLIQTIKKDNPHLTIIRITHNLDEAFQSDKVIVLSKGKIVFNDTPINVFKHEDELKALGLQTPFLIELNQALIKEGIIHQAIYSLDELVKKICK
ncbi:MAG: energy-coupling factor transporter ATPase [Bacilli bacterium]|nr:energy-coupling factor transporter ATPase [Bacilli bacterium]